MCLSGVDYYSTLGYQPGIAVLAAGALAPVATVFLVLLTLFGAVPVYRHIARQAPGGQGSIAVLARQITGWKGKLLILVLLGFVCTDFVITITLSAADATAHLLHTSGGSWNLPVTCLMIIALGVIFLRGFNEAIGISFVLVATYLFLNLAVVGEGVVHLIANPDLVGNWWASVRLTHPDPVGMVLIAALVFPKIALGLSGFETGVSVIPLIEGKDTEDQLRGATKLLSVSGVIMCLMLLASSMVVTTMVPAQALEPGGGANGRALAYLAHQELGPVVGGAYDWVTVAILWFAGASAMAGLLNLIPKFLPKFGMAPAWVARQRPLVFVVLSIALLVTVNFKANVDAQSGAYATGVLVLLFSGALASTMAVTRSLRSRRKANALLSQAMDASDNGTALPLLTDAYGLVHTQEFSAVDRLRARRGAEAGPEKIELAAYLLPIVFALVSIAFAYTAIANMIERPEGLHVASFFIVAIVVISAISRTRRAFELRAPAIEYDPLALKLIDAARVGGLTIVAHSCEATAIQDYERKEYEVRRRHLIPVERPIIFLEVGVRNASDFFSPVNVTGCRVGEASVLRATATAVPNAIAAIAVDLYRRGPVDVYFSWSPGSPIRDMLRYLTIGKGQNAVVVHEILRRAYPDWQSRPHVHVG
ncbi:amino acid transporter [Corynebacterium sp. SCR221107]|uniref:amino acid transporter n=1 Tax=Corynebacterium sp. SCR221107 TaxID=3017361 RepID=UPI0022EC4200|nr:amino acid transporter [Corynebacterium sp. SCR221107]WBT09978.1 amino acid transporter [Corynebacterium sp. SCR221107]